jgi:hypothetical protein
VRWAHPSPSFYIVGAIVLAALLIPYVLWTSAYVTAVREGLKERASKTSKIDLELARLEEELEDARSHLGSRTRPAPPPIP